MLKFTLIGVFAWFSLCGVWINPVRPQARDPGPSYGTEWWYSMGRGWDKQLARQNPFLAAHQHGQRQMLLHGWAPHVGRISRHQFVSPGLNTLGGRKFGFQSDFYLHELDSHAGNFRFRGVEGDDHSLEPGVWLSEAGDILLQAGDKTITLNPWQWLKFRKDIKCQVLQLGILQRFRK